jgi:membrane protease YdiL (CAAX protease family)
MSTVDVGNVGLIVIRLQKEFGVFVVGAVCLGGVARWGVPWLAAWANIDRFGAWMILSVPFVFSPVVALSLALLRTEGERSAGRLRLQAPPRRAWAWAAIAAGVIVLASGALSALANQWGLSLDPFHRVPSPWPVWMFAVWAVYWPVNILGEELAWRAIILPRMETLIGKQAWLLNGALWGVFHLGFGPGNLLVLTPTLLLVPWAAQKTRSTGVAVALHAFVSLPGMLMIAAGRL